MWACVLLMCSLAAGDYMLAHMWLNVCTRIAGVHFSKWCFVLIICLHTTYFAWRSGIRKTKWCVNVASGLVCTLLAYTCPLILTYIQECHLAFCMGQNPRLGAASYVSLIDDYVSGIIMEFAFGGGLCQGESIETDSLAASGGRRNRQPCSKRRV